jgi:hypothetical protein
MPVVAPASGPEFPSGGDAIGVERGTTATSGAVGSLDGDGLGTAGSDGAIESDGWPLGADVAEGDRDGAGAAGRAGIGWIETQRPSHAIRTPA